MQPVGVAPDELAGLAFSPLLGASVSATMQMTITIPPAPQASQGSQAGSVSQEGQPAPATVTVSPMAPPSKQITINFGGVTIYGSTDPDQAGRWQEELLAVLLQALQSETDPSGAPVSP